MPQIEASIEELAQEGMEARLAAAQTARDQSQAACEEAGAAVEAAERELAGAQAGDGRDESNRSLQERLGDAENAQANPQLTLSASRKNMVQPDLIMLSLLISVAPGLAMPSIQDTVAFS